MKGHSRHVFCFRFYSVFSIARFLRKKSIFHNAQSRENGEKMAGRATGEQLIAR